MHLPKSFLIFLLIACSSKVIKKPSLFGDGAAINGIPDEFEEVRALKTFPFKDVTEKYGLKNLKANHMAVVDLNGDNYSDLVIIPSFYDKAQFYYFNIEKKIFERGPSPFGEDEPMMTYAFYYDLNNDEVLDVLVGVLNQETELSRTPLRVFYGTLVKGQLQFKQQDFFKKPASNATVSLIDYDLDGKLDIFVGNWFDKGKNGPLAVPDQLFHFDGKTYIDKSKLLKEEGRQNPDKTMFINAGPTYGSQVCDMDQNGFPDILTTATNKYQNKMWMNRYKFREKYRYFQNYGVVSGYAGDPEGLLNTQGSGRSFAVACADYNNDTIMDVFLGELSHNYDNEGVDKSSLLTGRSLKFPPKFYRTEYFLDSNDPSWHQADRRGFWIDLNNDGLLDLIVDNSGYPPYTKMIVFIQEKDHSFTNKSQEYGLDLLNPTSTVGLDINRDGRMDLLTAQSDIRDASLKAKLVLFENQLELYGNRSMRFYLRGNQANYHGLNAMLILKVKTKEGKLSYRRQYVGYSYGSHPPQTEEGVHFGLAKGERLISVKVRWPFAKETETSRAKLEKVYKIQDNFDSYLNITLCENGDHLIGRRNCKN